MARFAEITKKQLAEIVNCYATAFPDWKIVGGGRLVRICFPVLQQIGFEALSSGSYRPSMVMRALPFQGIKMLSQQLGVKHRQLNLREHPLYWQKVVTAMEREFVPSVRQPLELPKVEKYEPTDSGESPLAAISDWVNVDCPKCGGAAKRETDTMPNWADNSRL